MLAPGSRPPGAVGEPTTPHRVRRGILKPRTKPQPAPWPGSPQGGQATTWDWPCSACPSGSSGAGCPLGPSPASGPSPPPMHTWRNATTHRRTPLPRPEHPCTCRYHAVHRVLRRMGLSPPLKYALPTTNQEVHQIRTRICKILAAAAKDGKVLLQASQPIRDHTNAPLQANTYTGTPHANPAPHPLPLPPHSPPSGPHAFTNAHSLGSRNTRLPPTAPTPTHARHRPSPAGSLATPHNRQPTHIRREEPHAARHTRPTQ